MKRTLVSLALVFATSFVAACGGSGGEPQTPTKATAAPDEAKDLKISLVVERTSDPAEPFVANVQASLSSALSAAGYTLVTDAKMADVNATVKVNATEQPSLFQVQVNGKTQVTYAVQLDASLVSASDASVVDQTTAKFESSDGTVDANAINSLVGHFSTSGKVAAYGGKLKTKAADAEKKVAQAEDDLWKAANADGCKNPVNAKACDGVNAYIEKYPSGKYTAEARAALQESDAKMAKMAEDEMWNAASVDSCKKPTKSYDCKSVEEYLKKYPTGAHAADAKASMKASEAQREALLKKEEASNKRASFEDCVKACRRAYADVRPAAYEILVSRCTQTECR